MRTLQRLIIPALDVCAEVGLYVRLAGAATLDVEERHVAMLRRGGAAHGHVLRCVLARHVVAEEHGGADRGSPRRLGDVHAGDARHRPRRERAGDRPSPGGLGFLGHGAPVARRARQWPVVVPSHLRVGGGPVSGPRDRHRRTSRRATSISVWRSRRSTGCRTSPPTSPGSSRFVKEQPELADDVSVIIVDNASNLELSVHGSRARRARLQSQPRRCRWLRPRPVGASPPRPGDPRAVHGRRHRLRTRGDRPHGGLPPLRRR